MKLIQLLEILFLVRLKKARKCYLKRLDFIKKIKGSNGAKRRIVLFTSTYWYPYIIGLAYLFRKTGHKVEIWLNEEFYFKNWPQYKESIIESKENLLYSDEDLVLKIIKCAFVKNLKNKNQDLLIKDLVMRQVYFDWQYEDKNGWSVNDVEWEFRKKKLAKKADLYCNAYKNLKEVIHVNKDMLFVTVNGKVSLGGLFYSAAKAVGADIVSIETWEVANSIIYNKGMPAVCWNTDVATKDYENNNYESALCYFEEHSSKRRNPKYDNENILRLQTSRYEEVKNDGDKDTALLCTNVSWDSAVLDKNIIFSNMMEWIDVTIAFFRKNRNKKLIIRCHPVEKMLKETVPVHEILSLKYGGLPENIKIVKGTDTDNTYNLLIKSSLLIVYTGTIGLEAAAMGKNVIVTGEVHYAERGFTNSPKSKTDYIEMLDLWAREKLKLENNQKNAVKYYQSYFQKFGLHVGNLWTNEFGLIPNENDSINLLDINKIEEITKALAE